MKPYQNIAELIEILESEIQSIRNDITTLKTKPKSFNEQVILKYIDTGSTGKTKDFVRTLGVLSERGSLFSSGEVSKLVKEGADDISPELLAIARKVGVWKGKRGR